MFPCLTSMVINMPFLHVQDFYWQCETWGSLRTIAKQFSVNIKDLCDIFFYIDIINTPLWIAQNQTNVIIITLGKSVTRAI